MQGKSFINITIYSPTENACFAVMFKSKEGPSEDTDIVAYPVFLVLRNALCNPCHVSDFL
jgi:hypothetical protein